MNDPRETSTLTSILKELAIVFSKLGATAFGGPAAHVAAIQAEVVDRRDWMSRERLLELYATAQFIPGYVLIAFLQQELVEGQHLLAHHQLLDAVSIGQITPGPLFTTATFIGYLLAGHDGAVAETVGIFLPGFCSFWCFVWGWIASKIHRGYKDFWRA